jgi:hypothetical protein
MEDQGGGEAQRVADPKRGGQHDQEWIFVPGKKVSYQCTQLHSPEQQSFANIFDEIFGENIGVFCLNYCLFLQIFDHNIGFWEKLLFFRRKKLSKIAENCDHNIDPREV